MDKKIFFTYFLTYVSLFSRINKKLGAAAGSHCDIEL